MRINFDASRITEGDAIKVQSKILPEKRDMCSNKSSSSVNT